MSASRQKAPYFRTAFRGPLRGMSSGTWKEGWSRRAYVDIGPYRLRNFLASDQIGSAIEEDGDDPRVVIRVGHYLFWRWALSVTSDDHSERQGFFGFWLHTLVITGVFCIVNLVLFSLLGVLGWLGVGLWGVHMYMNFSARNGSDLPRDDGVPEAG